MADRTHGSIGFITSNPATEAYQKGQLNAQRLYSNDLAIEGQMQQNAENLAAAPTRLRTLSANSDTARANADVAQRTVDPRVSQVQSQASSAATAAHVASETAPYTIDNAYQGNRVARVNADVNQVTAPLTVQNAQNAARTHQINADTLQQTAPLTVQNAQNAARTNEANANVAVETAPVRVQQQGTQLRQANAQALQTEMQGFYKSLELLNAGQTDAAIEVARQTGQEIPQAVIDNAELRAGITQAAKTAQTLYPSRPRDQQSYIQGFIENLGTQQRSGQPANDPTAPYNVAGAPTPPEISTTSTNAAPADVRTAEWMVANGVAPTAQAAWELVRQGRSNPQVIRSQIYRTALQTTFGNPQKAEEITAQAMQFIQQSGTPAAPAATPAPAAPRQAPQPAPSRVTPNVSPQAAAPQRPASVPQGSAYSPSRRMWRSPDGRLFDQSGNPA